MPKEKIFKSALYVILDLDLPYLKKDPISLTKDLISGGVDILQLRSKNFPGKSLVEIGLKIRNIIQKNDVIFIINDRVDIAQAVNADGVHLGQQDFPLNFARKILGKNKIIGLSTHNLIQIREAQKEDIDYISVGPIFKSPTKPNLKPIGIRILEKAVKISKFPIVAIGGINLENIEMVLSSGVSSIAVISAILKSKNIKKTTEIFKNYLNRYGN